ARRGVRSRPSPCVLLVEKPRRRHSSCLSRANLTPGPLRCQPEARAISGMQEDPLQIGIAGTGRMGAAIAARLLDRGHAVMVWNRTAEKTKALAAVGATVAARPRALSTAAECSITTRTDAAALSATNQGQNGWPARK